VAQPKLGPILAVLSALAVAAAAAFGFAPAQASARSSAQLSTLESGVLQQINFIRTQHGLVALRPSAELDEAALSHSEEMAADGYFEHSSADGLAFWKRIEHYYPWDSGYWSVGENLLWSSPGVGPSGALQLWMNSPEHRENILTPRWREIGVAAIHVHRAPGTFRNLPVTIITTDFGVRH
jgi:uncharacterized protein YkwD